VPEVKVALYARYSSDNQRDASIADQLRVCRAYAERQDWTICEEYTDHAVSGATLLRAGIQALMRDALNRRFDAVLAESLDRFSRDQEDTAGLFKRLTFAGVNIVTIAEGDIAHLHIGFKGTMNALFLKDLAEKTHRGLRGRVEDGKSAGGLCYGYRVVKTLNGATVTTGEREIVPVEARVERIFREFVGGVSPKRIAKNLNRENIAGPVGGAWSPSTIYGNGKRGTGILNNELYIGRLVWNRLRYVKNPDTGKRVSRLNPEAEWMRKEVPQLRIVSDELWVDAKQRQDVGRQAARTAGNPGGARRPQYLFSGLTKCGVWASAPGDGRPVSPEGDDTSASPGVLRHAHGGDRGAPWPHRRHHPDPGARHAQNRIEGESCGHAVGRHKCEEVARNRRPLAASSDGCGGPQPAEFGVLLDGCII
jgi:DNA invertase Pin-like site-specific DNA recombinase